MRPMDDAALRIPLVLAIELDEISIAQRSNTTREIDIVRDQHGLARIHANDESLVSAAVIIFGEDLRDVATALDLNVATVILESRHQRLV